MLAVVAVLAMNAFFFFKVAQILNKSFYNVKDKLHRICANLPCCWPREKYFERYANEKKKLKIAEELQRGIVTLFIIGEGKRGNARS